MPPVQACAQGNHTAAKGVARHRALPRSGHALVSICCARIQVNEAAEVIYDLVDPTANLIFGAVIDPRLGQEVRPKRLCHCLINPLVDADALAPLSYT